MCDLSIMHPIDSMECIGQRIISKVGSVVSSAFSTIFGGIVKWLTGLITDAVVWMLKTLGTFWVNIKTPSIGTSDNVPSDTIGWMWSHLGYYTVLLLVLSILLGAGRMMLARRAEPGVDTMKSVGTYVLVSSMGVAVTSGLIAAADAFSPWIIQQATGQDFSTAIGNMLNFSAATGTAAVAFIIIIIVGLVSVLASLIQVVLMVMRSTMLVLLTSVQGLAASATNTEMGKQWFKKLVAWTLAFILYKPVASIIYALAFRLMSSSSTDTGGGMVALIMGMAMLIMSLLGLPALMRFLVPAVAAVSGGSGAGAMAAGAIATGAVMLATGGAGAAAGGAGAAGAGASGASASGPGSAGSGSGGSGGGGGGPSDSSGGSPTGGAAGSPADVGSAVSDASGSGAASGGSGTPSAGAAETSSSGSSQSGADRSTGTGADGSSDSDGNAGAPSGSGADAQSGGTAGSSTAKRAGTTVLSRVGGGRGGRTGELIEDADNGPSGA